MSTQSTVLAFDLGASSGRAIVGRLDGSRLTTEEVHRFSNDPVQASGRLYWDILRLLHEIKQGILQARRQGHTDLKSMAIDSWAIDFGLLGAHGELLGNPYHYRDRHTDGLMEELGGKLGRERIFSQTGIQFLPFNTIYQLYALVKADSPQLHQAKTLLMIPDLLRYFLTGEQTGEFTNASTTQLFHPIRKTWETSLIEAIGVNPAIFPKVAESGTVVGTLSPAVCEELRVPSLPVIAVGEHDTAAAVAAVPALEDEFAYLSCGTWSLMGTELREPILSEQALAWNFTNEGGVYGTYRLLKNIMGLWLLQECKRAWDKTGSGISFAELVRMAEAEQPFRCFIDPDDLQFLNPPHMPEQIQQYCRNTNQDVPRTEGGIVRCIIESLALKYRMVLDRTERLAGKRFSGLHMVGGGINNTLLCRLTANAIGRPVWAGPTEGSAIGNVIVQMIANGDIADLKQARAIVRDSFPLTVYEPDDLESWDRAYAAFTRLAG